MRIDPSTLDLKEKVVYINRVTKVVKGGRNFRFSALVVVGDENGHVGVGMGKSIEIPEAIKKGIEDAKKNAERNELQDKASFVTADAAVWMPELAAKGQKADVVVLDPPRAGCDRSVLEAAVTMRPDRIVYVSCNPASLARDAAILAELGYAVREVQPVDLFPMTHHVEVVALIERKKP